LHLVTVMRCTNPNASVTQVQATRQR